MAPDQLYIQENFLEPIPSKEIKIRNTVSVDHLSQSNWGNVIQENIEQNNKNLFTR